MLAALALAGALLFSFEAIARVGGGEGFGGGGGGFRGGGGGGGGDGDGLGLILYLLIRLCIEYPAVGVPLLLIFLVLVAVHFSMQNRTSGVGVHRTYTPNPSAQRHARSDAIASLRASDAGFSLPVLQEFLALVHRRALEAAGTGAWESLTPFVDGTARAALQASLNGVSRVEQVVHGGLKIVRSATRGGHVELDAVFLGSRLEHLAKGSSRRIYFEEQWTFRRAASATSLPPDEMLRMGCPSCGAAVETDRMGACSVCATPITKGQLQWQAIAMTRLVARAFTPPKVSWLAGGDEPSVHGPTRAAPDLGTAFKRFTARHPDFQLPEFQQHVREVFLGLQAAWSDGAWDRARPWCTEPMYQNLRFYMEQYAAGGLHNRLGDVTFQRMAMAKVEQDAWYEAITVRVWASARDWVEDRDGNVVGGNDKVSRNFSEYWTFLRAAGTGAGSKSAHQCPSCGAPLDNVSAAGICGYCDTKITTGQFDWVLSRIDQVEVYQG